MMHTYNILNKYDEAIIISYEAADLLRSMVKQGMVKNGNKMFVQLYCEMAYSMMK